MKHILILMADFGYGHHSAANAVAQALQETYGQECQAEVVNPLDDPRAPAFLREEEQAYDRLVRELPDLYSLGYKVSESRVAGSLLKTTFTLMLFNVLREIVCQRRPDAIVCTYPFFQGMLEAVCVLERRHIPLLTVVTDLATVSHLWFHPAADLCLVPTQAVYDLAIQAGLPPARVRITGIPVRPELARAEPDKAALRSRLGWRGGLFTVLAIGSKRVEHLYDSLRALNHSGFPLQLVVVSGGDAEQYRRFQDTQWHVPAQVYDFVSEMGSFLRASDGVLSKAGGLTVSEALACGLPLILVDVIPGQETGNADYVVAGGAGELARDALQVLEAMSHWLENDRARYQQQAQNARRLGRPRAALEVAELAWAAASGKK